ncbi:MAG: amino acid ABC transporter substrate-binding protein [Pseudomonadota bacterium]|uniref:amino acid ABC transporter substrate-binding protein n=1 Tax=Phenylobacterium sp. TaxID=1871053 RepID=UPI0025EB7D32|nr:amino acid ABC transporter substrate-binding protein [Phenylobacterium sp.]MBT9472434.1 amino acid ABC transporter substrate-binding protein [Phenylobacterium sp.]
MVLTGCSKAKEEAPAPPPAAAPIAAPAPGAYKPKPSPTLAAIKARGWLSCGVNPGLAGFAYSDDRGAWRGFDIDVCRAVAAAVLGDAKAARFTTVTAPERFTALRGGKIDILSRNTSWTLSRDAGEGVDFAAVTYYDGQGFLAPKTLSLASADELNGARICVQKGTASETNLADYFQARGLKYQAVVVNNGAEARARYQAEECDVFTADMAALASARSLMNTPNAHVILPTVISKEPLGPVVRQDDPAWTDIVRWTVYATILAEELGVDSKSAPDQLKTSTDPRVRRLLGAQDNLGPILGLKPDWAYQVIVQVGSYDEIFERNLGQGSSLKLARGHNALWSAVEPGLMYAPPVR